MPSTPGRRASAVKQPCESCKEKHVKCDDGRPRCGRCQAKSLQCVRKTRPTSFRPGSSARYDARFTGNEHWVSGSTVQFQLQQPGEESSSQTTPTADVVMQSIRPICPETVNTGPGTGQSPHATTFGQQSISPQTIIHAPYTPEHNPHLIIIDSLTNPLNATTELPRTPHLATDQAPQSEDTAQRLSTQEACLLRYFIEEISPWFDTCDERRHFQLEIPVRARNYPPLLHAIFATSARRLSRIPEYQTPQGIKYHGQLLTGITPHFAMENMLACIPALRSFHQTQDKEHQELIVATAIILRQFEEMEDDEENSSFTTPEPTSPNTPNSERVNFLDIINTVIRSSHLEETFDPQGLSNAAYWISLRQEVYYAFRRGRSPQMLLAPEQWVHAAPANKTVMHAAQVAKWLFEYRSEQEWLRLKQQEGLLEQQISDQTQYAPILNRAPDKTKGEVFPTLWYGSDLVVTSIQHVLIAKMVLIAEDPHIMTHSNPREANRKAESEVRNIILELCGIGLNRLGCPPALVNGIVGILLYGDFFTDQWERQALAGVIERFQEFCAWPLPKALRSFK